MKTKKTPNDLKCKINHTFFFWKQGFPKGGEGGGGLTLGKNSQKILYFFLGASLIALILTIVRVLITYNIQVLDHCQRHWSKITQQGCIVQQHLLPMIAFRQKKNSKQECKGFTAGGEEVSRHSGEPRLMSV